MPRTLLIALTYDGTDFSGWQVQKNGRSVQAAMERAWRMVTGEDRRLQSSSRTDSGVHALGQGVSVTTECDLECGVLVRALNAYLPREVVVTRIAEAPAGFHALRSAVGKRYRYIVQDGRLLDVFTQRYAWFVPQHLDDGAMREAAAALVGRHDFASFQSTGSERKSTVRTIYELTVNRRTENGLPRVVVEVEGDGFLYNMVRAIVGTLVQVGRGDKPPAWVAEVRAACDRSLAGMTAPPHGLFLVHVDYQAGFSTRSPVHSDCRPGSYGE